jgi:hypothetical protein
MDDLIKYGWIERDLTNYEMGLVFLRISTLMRAYKSQEIENFQYVLIDKYFIDSENNLYFLGNSQVYNIDLNDDFCYKSDLESLENDYKKIKFICEYTMYNVFKYELVSNKYKREKRINEILNQF